VCYEYCTFFTVISFYRSCLGLEHSGVLAESSVV
jgi:hypothetical protein